MKQLVFISILLLNTMLVIAQLVDQPNCDNLRYFISPSESVEERIEVTDQVIDRKLNICSEWEVIYFSVTSTNKDTIKIGRNIRSTAEYFEIDKMQELSYFLIYGEDKFCRGYGGTLSVRLKILNNSNTISSISTDFKQINKLCYGTKVLYKNSTNFALDSPANNFFQGFINEFSIVEWNSNGIFVERNSNGTLSEISDSTCNWVKVELYPNKSAPNGKIKPFGSSNTLVFADSDNSAKHLQYQWFYVDLFGSGATIYNEFPNANERIIDCNDFDCLFAFGTEQTSKVLGLEIYNGQSGCTNLIFYDELELFPGLKDIPVGLVDVKFNQHFNLYPNFNNGKFFIQLENIANHNYKLAIYNALGKLILTKNLNHQSTQQINISNIESGIYFAVLKQKNQAIAQQKLIIH